MWLSVIPLCIGRFMLGFGGGLFTVICGVYMAETIPAEKLSLYGTSINTGIVTGLLVTNLIQGFTLPDASDAVKVSATDAWRYGFLAPGIFAVVNMAMWALLLKRDSLYFLIEQGSDQEEDAFELFKRIYIYENEDETRNGWTKLKEERAEINKVKADEPQVSYGTIFADRRFRTLSVFCLLAGIINQCTGINAINIYSSEILKSIPQIPTNIGVYMLSVANIVGALFGPVVNKFFGIR